MDGYDSKEVVIRRVGQLVVRRVWGAEVVSSSLTTPTKMVGAEGRGFESRLSDQRVFMSCEPAMEKLGRVLSIARQSKQGILGGAITSPKSGSSAAWQRVCFGSRRSRVRISPARPARAEDSQSEAVRHSPSISPRVAQFWLEHAPDKGGVDSSSLSTRTTC